ncbi:unnamed protein product, partial [Polarella glacialis]
MRPRIWLLAVISALLVQPADPWLLVNKDGNVTLLGTIDIDPQYAQQPRISLKQSGVRLWDIIVQEIYGPNDLVLQTPGGGKVAFTQNDEAFFNTTLSVLNEVKLGGSLAVFDSVVMGSRFSVYSSTALWGTLSV